MYIYIYVIMHALTHDKHMCIAHDKYMCASPITNTCVSPPVHPNLYLRQELQPFMVQSLGSLGSYVGISSSDPADTLFWHSFWHTIWKYIYIWHTCIYSGLAEKKCWLCQRQSPGITGPIRFFSAMRWLHNRYIAHCDISMENILVTKDTFSTGSMGKDALILA